VAGITYLGQRDYSMRVWLDADKMATLASAPWTCHGRQPAERAGRRRANRPAAGPHGQQFSDINTLGRLIDPEQFKDIILKSIRATRRAGLDDLHAGFDGTGGHGERGEPRRSGAGIVRLRDVRGSSRVAAIRPILHPGRQALRGALDLPASRLQRAGNGGRRVCQDEGPQDPLSEGLDYEIVYDTTPFIRESVNEVFYTCATRCCWWRSWCWCPAGLEAMILPMIDGRSR